VGSMALSLRRAPVRRWIVVILAATRDSR
jgi:hypothetical protein